MQTHHLILGTAGHIDHGKTSLIRALTGAETDRLPEEKKRGITIELGYASLTLDSFVFGIVDVPGHEKFVRQMLAGATGMDLVMLVVAADDSVKQQTIEHLEILRMLNLKHGLIALTKCDLMEEDWLELVEEEIRQRVAGSFLEAAPIVRSSSATGQGIDEIKTKLVQQAQLVVDSRIEDSHQKPFRMAIDRTFTIAGHGTVVTGSVNSGTLSVGDQLEIQPGHLDVRVRGIQNHDQAAESISRGQRGAINLAGVHHNDIERGQELAAKNLLNASRSMILNIQMLPELKRPLIDRQRLRFHVGTAEILGFVRLLLDDSGTQNPRQLVADQSGIAQIFLSEPAVAVWNQPFVIRSESPVQTLGGGRVIHPFSPRINRKNEHQLAAAGKLVSEDSRDRVSALIYLSPVAQWNRNDLAAAAGVVDVDSMVQQLVEQGELMPLDLGSNRELFVHRSHLAEIAQTIDEKVARYHDENPLAFGMQLDQIKSYFTYLPSPEIVQLVVRMMIDEGKLERRQTVYGLKGCGPQLSKNEQGLLKEIIERFAEAGLQSPTATEIQKTIKKNRDSVPQLLELACGRGDLIKIADDYLVHSSTLDFVKSELKKLLDTQNGATLSEIRQQLGATRKYVVPLCEYLDGIAFTRRDGDKRFIA